MKSPNQLMNHMRTLAFAHTHTDPDFAGDRADSLFQGLLVLAWELTRKDVDRETLRVMLGRAIRDPSRMEAGQIEAGSTAHSVGKEQTDLDILNRLASKTKHNKKGR
jgi:hypothetical protein